MAKKNATEEYTPLSGTNFPKATSSDIAGAKAKVGQQYQGQQDALDRSMRQIQRDTDFQTNVQREVGDVHGKRLGEISQLLQNQLQQNTGRVESTFQGAQQDIGAAYGRAQEASQGASQRVTDQVREAMARLGLDAAGPDVLKQLEQQRTDNQALGELSGAGAVGGIAGLGAEMVALHTKAESDSAQEWAGKQEAFAKRVQDSITQINLDHNQKRNEILGQLATLAKERGFAFTTNLMETIDRRLERERADRMEALQAEIQRGQLAVARQNAATSARSASANIDIQRQRLALEKERNNPQSPLYSDDPLIRMQAQRDYRAAEAELNDIVSGGGGQPAPTQFRGQEGVQQFASQKFGPQRGSQMANAYLDMRLRAQAESAGSNISVDQILGNQIASQPYAARRALQELDHVFNNQYSSFSQ